MTTRLTLARVTEAYAFVDAKVSVNRTLHDDDDAWSLCPIAAVVAAKDVVGHKTLEEFVAAAGLSEPYASAFLSGWGGYVTEQPGKKLKGESKLRRDLAAGYEDGTALRKHFGLRSPLKGGSE